jgi:diguanylate cyclase (GGDEF)-like protein
MPLLPCLGALAAEYPWQHSRDMASYALIAEPDPSRAAGLLSLVAGEGLEGVVVRDGAEAQDVVRQRSAPLLLVTDLALPRVDGFALLTWLRERADAVGTQVVVVTAFDELRVRAWQFKDALGIHSLLSRRATPELMRDTVRRVIAGQRASLLFSPEPTAEQERQRLARIDALRLVDEGPPDAELQGLVTEVAQAFGVPVALLSLVLGDRQWFKAHVGLPPSLARDRATPRDWSFCHHVVQGRESLVVPDATRHPVFRDNPLVRDGIVGSYAGAPLLTSTGDVLGSLCVIDTRPLVLGAEDLAALRELARRVAEDLEQKARARQAAALAAQPEARSRPGAPPEQTARERQAATLLTAPEARSRLEAPPEQTARAWLAAGLQAPQDLEQKARARQAAGLQAPQDPELKARARQAAALLSTSEARLFSGPPLTEGAALEVLREAVRALDVPALLVAPGRRPYAGNGALADLLGLPSERLSGMTFEAFCLHVAGLTADPAAALRQLDLAAGSSRGLHLTLALERPQPRRLRWVARPFPVPGGVAQLLTLLDVASAPAREEREERERLLRVDALTGLDTRRAGEERLLREIGRCRRDGVPCSVLLVDVVGLGRLNMERGFDAGDAALRDVARRLDGLRGPSGFGVRWEGGTLLLALPGVGAEDAEAVRQRLLAVPAPPKVVAATVCVEGEEDPQHTLARAQAALTRARAESPPSG